MPSIKDRLIYKEESVYHSEVEKANKETEEEDQENISFLLNYSIGTSSKSKKRQIVEEDEDDNEPLISNRVLRSQTKKTK